VERFFEVKGYSDEKSFEIAILKLKKMPPFGVKTLKSNDLGKEKPRIHTWPKLKKLMSKRFLPGEQKRDLYLRVSSLTQGRMSLEEYIREFEQLKIRRGIEQEADQVVEIFLRGLD